MNDRISSSASSGESIRIEYVPRVGLLSLSLVNFLLTLLTLGIYRFWAKTNIRKHIWSCVHINGQPLEYTGKGIELFKGALFVFLVFGLPLVLLITGVNIAYGPDHPAIVGVQLLVFLVFALLWGAAVYRARRYQLSRTLWRGIRGTLVGSATTYSLTYFGSILARGISLGWSTPVMNFNLQQQIIGDMRFGDMPFTFKGRAGPLYPAYTLCWFLTIGAVIGLIVFGVTSIAAIYGGDFAAFATEMSNPDDAPTGKMNSAAVTIITLVLCFYAAVIFLYPMIWAIYKAHELSVFANYTGIDQARFKLDATALSLIGLTIGNLLLWIFTLGIATPYVEQRLVRYLCDRIRVEGTVDIDSIMQSKAPLGTMGEGLADAFDVGGI